jgi:PTH2 family peptidyl-tRNA hydrolase
MSRVKQVIVMRTDLKMRKGKMIAQGSHASMKIFFDMMSLECGLHSAKNGDRYKYQLWLPKGNLGEDMREWVEGAFTKICVRAESEEQLIDLRDQALSAGLPVALIQDSGATEFNGVPTYTSIAIGPAQSKCIDMITGDLKLL